MVSEQTQRIIRIMESENMNATQFAEAIGIQRAAMSHIMNGRNNPSADVITKIVERFETINPGWLLSGKGSMRITPNNAGNSNYLFDNQSTNHGLTATDNDQNSIIFKPDGGSNEPDLFSRNNNEMHKPPSQDNNIRTDDRFSNENREGDGVNDQNNTCKTIEKEVVIYKERPVKTINKLLIFYSDNTYETFIPEKHE